MFTWLTNNLGTIIICAVLIAIVAAIIISLIKRKSRASPWYATAAAANPVPCPAPAISNNLILYIAKPPVQ